MDSNKQNLINKILYRAQYRGTKEMDIFVSKFVNSIINNLDHKELVSLDKLIKSPNAQSISDSLKKYGACDSPDLINFTYENA